MPEVADPDLQDVTAAKLSVDRKVEQCAIAQSAMAIEKEADRQTSRGFSGHLVPMIWPAFHGRLLRNGIEI
ncbi:hypothetical protein [Sphingomonas cavernae]|uniref:hypothetical protein n=1 Tax=Sphingomonas cavernae TaxID=2320861 RepID=UPI001601216E